MPASISQIQRLLLARQQRVDVSKPGFLKLPGEALAIIGEFLNEKLPLFIFTNRITFKVSLQYQIGYYEHQR